VRVAARDVGLTLAPVEGTSVANQLPARVERIEDDLQPALALVHLRVGPSALLARITRRSADALRLAPGGAVWAQVKSVALVS
jgi:molybdate transport system ATP-binding protein